MEFLKWNKLQSGKSEIVFGNILSNIPRYLPLHEVNEEKQTESALEYGLPLFIVKCIRKIDTMIKTDGLYRINGCFETVEKLRYSVLLEN